MKHARCDYYRTVTVWRVRADTGVKRPQSIDLLSKSNDNIRCQPAPIATGTLKWWGIGRAASQSAGTGTAAKRRGSLLLIEHVGVVVWVVEVGSCAHSRLGARPRWPNERRFQVGIC